MITVLPLNETYVKVMIEDFGIEQEFSEFFTFFTKGYQFSPAYKKGQWDGKIRLFNQKNKSIYKGLLDVIIAFAKLNSYELEIDSSLNNKFKDYSGEELRVYLDELKIASKGNQIDIRDYQLLAIENAIKFYRSILISPTGSGKSLIIYAAIRYLLEMNPDEKILIIVPTTMLVEQLFKDFFDYSTVNGWVVEEHIQLLYSGKDKVFSKSIMISTWQSLHAMKKNSPQLFIDITDVCTVGVFDEAHTYKATEVLGTLEKLMFTKRRIGTTGTLDDNSKINELALRGLMGPVYKVKTTRELIDEGTLSEIKVKILKLRYPAHVCKAMKGSDYQTEIDFIIGQQSRNKFICQLAKSCKGTTLITFALVERHGKLIHAMLQDMIGDRKIYFVSGAVAGDERERIRVIASDDPTAIIVASEKLFSTGVNIPGITNIILGMPRKSSILIRQTIGRGLRLFDGKAHMNLYDICDDLSVGRVKNVTLKSLDERMTIYIKDEFPYTVTEVDLTRFE